MDDPLKDFYPKWVANCTESIRFLQSGEEYAAFLAKHGLPQETPEGIAKKVQEYTDMREHYQKCIKELGL